MKQNEGKLKLWRNNKEIINSQQVFKNAHHAASVKESSDGEVSYRDAEHLIAEDKAINTI